MRWVDVDESDWFYNDVIEATTILLESGRPLVEGIGYANFEEGAPYVYEEHSASPGKKEFKLNKKIEPTVDNPLYVYVDGVQTVYKEVVQNSDSTTTVVLYYAPSSGTLSFASYGRPKVDRFGKPLAPSITPVHPNKVLDYADTYYYDKFNRRYHEYVYAFGRALKRLEIDDDEWSNDTEANVVRRNIGLSSDVYTVSPTGIVWLPYNLDGVTCRMTYTSLENGVVRLRGGHFKATSNRVMHNNRFFPQALINRAEAFVLIDRLRSIFYSRFTDLNAPTNELSQEFIAYEGQKVFKLNGNYPQGEELLEVYVDGTRKRVSIDYQEFDNNTVLFTYPLPEGKKVSFFYKKTISTRFADVGVETGIHNSSTGDRIYIDGRVGSSWWAPHVIAMEDEVYDKGEYLINGLRITRLNNGYAVVDNMYNPLGGDNNTDEIRFMPHTLLTRAQAVAFLNRFRKWCVKRFK